MSPASDNWGRLVAAAVRKQQLWELFHQHSRSPSLSTESSDSSFSFQLNSSTNDFFLPFSSFKDSASNQREEDSRADPDFIDDISEGRTAAAGKVSSSTIMNQASIIPENPSSSSYRRKRNLIVQVPRVGGRYTEPKCSGADYAKTTPLPLPPMASSNSSTPFSHLNSAAASQSPPPCSTGSVNILRTGWCWKKGRLLGKDQHGNVYAGFNSETGEMCAIKEILLTSDARSQLASNRWEQEISLLSRLKHPNIVRYYGSEMINDKFSVYVEYVSGGSISKILKQYGILGDSALRSYTYQILAGLTYLHSKHAVHRNIRGATILVDSNGCIKLSDFGMAKHGYWTADPSHPRLCSTNPYWMAPEVIENSTVCNQAIDIWSLGCTILEMATSRPPWSQYNETMAMFKITRCRELPVIPHYLSDDGKDFVKKCLNWNPHLRPTATQLLKHPFVTNVKFLEGSLLLDHNVVINALKSQVRSPYQLESDRFAESRSPTNSRNMSSPISPFGFDFHNPRSPQCLSQTVSPSTISPCTSGSSTPGTAFHHARSPQYLSPAMSPSTRSPSTSGSSTPRAAFHHPRSPQYLSPSTSPSTRSPTRSGSSTPLADHGFHLTRSPQYLSLAMPPSTRYPTRSGSPPPLTNWTSGLPYLYLNQSVMQQESFHHAQPKLPLSPSSKGHSYWDPDILQRQSYR